MRKRESYFRNLDRSRALLMSIPFGVAAFTAQNLHAVDHNVNDLATLRAAVDAVNASSTNDRILIAAGTIALTGAPLENANASGDLDITKATGDLEIIGAGMSTTILDGINNDRVLHIHASVTGTVTVSALTITNGLATDDGTATSSASGGGILQLGGNLTLTNVRLQNNRARGAAGSTSVPAGATGGTGAGGSGGGIYAGAGILSITGSELLQNGAQGGNGGNGGGGSSSPGGSGGSGGSAAGGAILSAGTTVSITSTTLTGNSATGGSGGNGAGGGITSFSSIGYSGGTGGSGGGANGGGLFTTSAVVTLTDVAATQSTAQAGNGGTGGSGNGGILVNGNGGAGGSGGTAVGGVMFAGGTSTTIVNSTLANNSSLAGSGGAGGVGANASFNGGIGGAGGNAGTARSSGIHLTAGTLTLQQSTLDAGNTTGGTGGEGGAGGAAFSFPGSGGVGGSGGNAIGGGIHASGAAAVIVSASTISNHNTTAGVGGLGGEGGNAFSSGGDGGAGGAGASAQGAALRVDSGALTITNSTIAGNQAQGGAGGAGGGGGTGSVSGGNGGSGGSGGDATAGAVFSASGTVDIDNSTIASNSAIEGAGGSGGSGGMGSSTAAPDGVIGTGGLGFGGGMVFSAGTVTIDSTIVANNAAVTASDISGSVTANNSLIEDPVGATIAGTGNLNGDPILGPLQDNGGTTFTMAIASNSPARNTGSNPLTLTTDQRGEARDDGNGVDMGAYERQPNTSGGGGKKKKDEDCSTGTNPGGWSLLAALGSLFALALRRKRQAE